MLLNDTENVQFPLKTLYGVEWDEEWAADWSQIVEIFDTIDSLEKQFNNLSVSFLRELSQKQLILNLRKYAYTLKAIIIRKYS